MSDLPDEVEGDVYPPTPFSFKLMVTLGGLYIGWRVIELLVRFIRWIG